jgi:hypothetical protein
VGGQAGEAVGLSGGRVARRPTGPRAFVPSVGIAQHGFRLSIVRQKMSRRANSSRQIIRLAQACARRATGSVHRWRAWAKTCTMPSAREKYDASSLRTAPLGFLQSSAYTDSTKGVRVSQASLHVPSSVVTGTAQGGAREHTATISQHVGRGRGAFVWLSIGAHAVEKLKSTWSRSGRSVGRRWLVRGQGDAPLEAAGWGARRARRGGARAATSCKSKECL